MNTQLQSFLIALPVSQWVLSDHDFEDVKKGTQRKPALGETWTYNPN